MKKYDRVDLTNKDIAVLRRLRVRGQLRGPLAVMPGVLNKRQRARARCLAHSSIKLLKRKLLSKKS